MANASNTPKSDGETGKSSNKVTSNSGGNQYRVPNYTCKTGKGDTPNSDVNKTDKKLLNHTMVSPTNPSPTPNTNRSTPNTNITTPGTPTTPPSTQTPAPSSPNMPGQPAPAIPRQNGTPMNTPPVNPRTPVPSQTSPNIPGSMPGGMSGQPTPMMPRQNGSPMMPGQNSPTPMMPRQNGSPMSTPPVNPRTSMPSQTFPNMPGSMPGGMSGQPTPMMPRQSGSTPMMPGQNGTAPMMPGAPTNPQMPMGTPSMPNTFPNMPFSEYPANPNEMPYMMYPGMQPNMYLPGDARYNVPMGVPLLPLYGYSNNTDLDKDVEYMRQLYPNTAKQIQSQVDSECDKLEYDGSFMFDEYPDRTTIDKIVDKIFDKIKDTQEQPQMKTQEYYNPGYYRQNYLRDIVSLMLLNEFFHRRRRYRCRRCWF